MTTPELHERVYFHADRQRSRRYTRSIITNALNVAIDAFINDRYDNIKKLTAYSFERVERIRQELDPLVVHTFIPPSTTNVYLAPADMRYALLSLVQVDNAGPFVLLQEPGLNEADREENDFLSASADFPYTRRYGGGTWQMFPSAGHAVTSWELYYLKYQSVIVFGDAVITAGANVLVTGQFYNVVDGTVTHNAVNYTQGQSFQAANTTLAGTGSVALFTNTNMPLTSHEEIAVSAAAILMGTFENYQKRAVKEQERMQQ